MMLQKDAERLVLVPWTYQKNIPELESFLEVVQYLLGLYCSVWENATQPNLIKNLTRTLQNRWDDSMPMNELGAAAQELLKEITTMHRARYLLTGHISASQCAEHPERIQSINVQILLHDTYTQQWALNHVISLKYFEPKRHSLNDLAPASWMLEELMRSISLYLIAFMNPESVHLKMSDIATFRLGSSFDLLVDIAKVDKLSTASARAEGYQLLSEESPKNCLVYLMLGRQLKLNRKYIQATRALAQAVSSSHFPRRMRAQILNELGSCVALSGEREHAIDHWMNAIEADPTHILAYMNIAHAYEELGQESKAEHYLKQVLNYAPGDTRVYHALARIYSCQEKWGKAIAQYKLQLLLDPSDPWCHNNLGTCSLQQENKDQAIKHFKRAQLLDPKGEAGQYASLVLSGMEGNIEEYISSMEM